MAANSRTKSRDERRQPPAATTAVKRALRDDGNGTSKDNKKRPNGQAIAREGNREGMHDPLGILRQHPAIVLVIFLVVVAAIVGGVLWWLYARRYESTDDAFVAARTVTISAEVSGRISDVASAADACPTRMRRADIGSSGWVVRGCPVLKANRASPASALQKCKIDPACHHRDPLVVRAKGGTRCNCD